MITKKTVTCVLTLWLGFCLSALAENTQLDVRLDERAVESVAQQVRVSYADVLEGATPSVVSVYTTEIVSAAANRQIPEFFRHFGIPVPPGLEAESEKKERREPLGVGSGVIVSSDGYIITNHHVVTGRDGDVADEIKIRLSDDREYPASLIGSDSKTDVAVLKVEIEDPLPAITLTTSQNLRVGDIVFAIGNPLNVGLTATQGIISATGRTSYNILGPGAYENFVQTDAAINMGNSGGALVDAMGRLIGINTAIVSRSGGSNGIGFAIPTDLALNVATKLIDSGHVPRGLLGLIPENLDRDVADAFDLDSTLGALVTEVMADSPADEAGIQHGDVIVQIDDITIKSAPQLRLVVSQMLPGSEVEVTLIRAGKRLQREVTLGSVDDPMAQNGSVNSKLLEGVSIQVLDDALREQYAIPIEIDGVVITDVRIDSPYANTLVEGLAITDVNGEAIDSVKDFAQAIKVGANRLYGWYGGMRRYIGLRVLAN
jgi:serine protease Do/serine protease DegQ